MLIDARTIPQCTELQADICIVGAGAAGIFLAITLARAGFDSLVLEAGGVGVDPECQALYGGEIVGLPYELDGTRTRRLGGSTNCWGGFCLPFDRQLFEARPWLTDASWPIAADEIIPFYGKAADFLGLDIDSFESVSFDGLDRLLLPTHTDELRTSVSQLVRARRRFGKYFRKELRGSTRIRVLLYATAAELHTEDAGRRIAAVKVVTEPGRSLIVRSTIIILAAGAIENARLMLLSHVRQPRGIGNGYDVVGRYFMEHPWVDLAKVWLRDRPARAKPYDAPYAFRWFKKCLGLHLSPGIQAQERIASASCFLEGEVYGGNSTATDSLRVLYRHIRQGRSTPELARHLLGVLGGLPAVTLLLTWYAFGIEAVVNFRKLRAVIEPWPNPESRITLSEEKDRLGMNKVRLDWRLCEADRHTVRRTTEIICSALRKSECLIVEPLPAALDGSCLSSPNWTWHHMGTTRMGIDPRRSVVDVNCRVHGLDNVYVAGSSVFPTAGNHSPTFTIIAITARLAEHIIGEFRNGQISATSPLA